MSDMFKVYQNFSGLYDELVNHEDYENNLCKFLNNNIQWENKVVGEFETIFAVGAKDAGDART